MSDKPVKTKKKPRGGNSPIIGDNGYNLQEGDTSRFLRHVMANKGMPPIDISDPVQVEDRIAWYFNHCVEDDIKPTVGGLCNSLGISRDTLNKWKREKQRSGTHTDIIKKAYEMMDELWEHYMMNGKINPVTGIYLGKVLYGHIEEQHITITPNNPLGESSDYQAIEEKYKQLPND
jgi:hypothetical protein